MKQPLVNLDEIKPSEPGIEEQYMRFFVPNPPLVWRFHDDDFSLDQPSPLKVVPSETIYGIESLVCLHPNG